jgi:polysaccharide export outer membrane protein
MNKLILFLAVGLIIGVESGLVHLRADDGNRRSSTPTRSISVADQSNVRLAPQTKTSTDAATDRKIEQGDIIIVDVFGEKELSGEHRVQQTGTIKYPLLGSVEVAGKTPRQVASMLQQMLEADYLVDPQVNVMVKDYRSRTVSVIGQVNRPGAIELPGEQRIDVLEGIARAGGFERLANKNKIELSRKGKSTTYKFDDLRRETNPSKKIWLEPGDVIYVHETFF